ncbi:hypothetical protein NPIL_417361 [Nephila pilipes]|uniref:Uncharacterized protein n=1 Tax=Nephila pilipes TaxID=299642 RepID=A0A8X6IN26_NEPPI|nr:hypothetical protein NPIL_417361 [Nephila pilipes]
MALKCFTAGTLSAAEPFNSLDGKRFTVVAGVNLLAKRVCCRWTASSTETGKIQTKRRIALREEGSAGAKGDEAILAFGACCDTAKAERQRLKAANKMFATAESTSF